MDLYARKIIAWTLADTMEVSTVIETINKAKDCRNTDLPLIIHSDRGSQYVSNAWREATEKMQQSYSHSGYPYDNACIESFHSLIKREWLNRFHIINYKHAYRLVFEYIETFYNTVRIHTICLLMILKNCLRGYLLCQQLSWQNFSFYFVLNLDTGPPWKVIQFRASQAKQTQARCSESSSTLFQPAEPFHCVPDNQNDEGILNQPFLSIFEKAHRKLCRSHFFSVRSKTNLPCSFRLPVWQ